MAEMIRLSGAAPTVLEPPVTRCDGLSFAERLALWALRRAVMGMRHRHDEGPILAAALGKLGIGPAVAAIEGFAMSLAWKAERPIAIRAPGDPEISPHERQILFAFACRQIGAARCAVDILEGLAPQDRLPAALEYLASWADHFSRAGLYLPPRCPARGAMTYLH